MKKIIPIFQPIKAGNEKKYLQKCADTEWFSARGPFVKKFEDSLSEYIGMKYGVSTSNCTVALHLALKALNIGPGDEVICPVLTFISPIHMVKLSGAKPVLVDIEEETWNLNPLKIEQAITKNTKAIIVVHAFGQSAMMDEIIKIAKNNNLYIIEDVAESLGATFRKKRLGSLGIISCFSFFANKMITSGEGGMALTNDSKLFQKLSSLREYGSNNNEKYIYDDIGFNYRMTNMQAAVGLAQLEKFDVIMKKRDQQLLFYKKLISEIDNVCLRPYTKIGKSVHWLLTLLIKKDNARDKIIDSLFNKGIEARKMIYPAYYSKPYESYGNAKLYPIAEKISLNSFHLPSSTNLTMDEIKFIVDSLKETIREICL